MSILSSIKHRFFTEVEPAMVAERTGQLNKVVMYSTRFCPFCMRARALLQQKSVAYKDIAVDGNPALRDEMVAKSGRFTVPQIWIGDTHVGGCDELMQLEREGTLDVVLASNEEST